MEKILKVPLVILFVIYLYPLCEADDINKEGESKEIVEIHRKRELEDPKATSPRYDKPSTSEVLHRRVGLHICKFQNGSSISCCLKIWKYDVCNSLGLFQHLADPKDLYIDFEISVNKKAIFTDKVSLNDLPPLCYINGGFSICLRLILKGDLQQINNDVFWRPNICAEFTIDWDSIASIHFDVFCLPLVKKSNREDKLHHAQIAPK